jgi:AAA domain
MSVREELLSFLRDPEQFAETASDREIWLRGLERFALLKIAEAGDWTLRPAQERAWRGLADRRVGLVLGPPGTGKTHLLSWLIAGYRHARREANLPSRVFVTAFTRNAVGNVLDAVCNRFATHAPNAPPPLYIGTPPPGGLSDAVEQLGRDADARAPAAIAEGDVVLGGTIWSLYRMLDTQSVDGAEGPTAPLFDLVCIDEASQLVLGHGLLALAGLAAGGRVVVAGDDQQLPPVRAARTVSVDGRELGGSLYAFLKSTNVAEFPLDETFRLNAPLTVFPERKFYPGRYTSVAPDKRLRLRQNWSDGLLGWQKAALDPEFPIVLFVHDGPPAATSNPFEAQLIAQLAGILLERIEAIGGGPLPLELFWSDIVAVVSPHRAQNAAIRRMIGEVGSARAFVETVDRVQGKERDIVPTASPIQSSRWPKPSSFFRPKGSMSLLRAPARSL